MICAIIRHPKLREGQTALSINYLRVLHRMHGNNLKVIDTTRIINAVKVAGTTMLSPTNKYGFYLIEALITAFNSCDEIHLLNTNKVLPALANQLLNQKVISYQFSYLPSIHSNWKIKRAIIERGSDIVVGSSRRIARLFKNGCFVNPPIDVELFKPRDKVAVRKLLGLPLNVRIVGYIGDIDVNRGFDIVARLMNTVKGNVKFLVASLRVDNISAETMSNLVNAVSRGAALLMFKEVPIWYIYNAIDIL
ncbi:MAG: hypothetical protein ACPL07_02550, partial [Candidatus Bathyarchaeia archaeon]